MVRYPPLALSFAQAHLCDAQFGNISHDNCAMPHEKQARRTLAILSLQASRDMRAGFWQNGFFADFYFWAAGFFRGFCRRMFLLVFVGKRSQKIPPGKSPAKSSKIYTTKIPDIFLQRGRAKRYEKYRCWASETPTIGSVAHGNERQQGKHPPLTGSEVMAKKSVSRQRSLGKGRRVIILLMHSNLSHLCRSPPDTTTCWSLSDGTVDAEDNYIYRELVGDWVPEILHADLSQIRINYWNL